MQITSGHEKSSLNLDLFKCPFCQSDVEMNIVRCSQSHEFEIQDGVIRLMRPTFARDLDKYLRKFEQVRQKQGWPINDYSIYPRLPFIAEDEAMGHWKPKQYDLIEIRKEISGKNRLKVLDLGAWNGWLSNRLAESGHQVTAIDYFIDEKDGLGAKKYYPNDFLAIQMDLEDISILPRDFDLIIINRGLPYFSDFVSHIKTLKQHLNPGGKLLITGIAIYQNGKQRFDSLNNYKAQHQIKYGMELFFRPVKGYLDKDDFNSLKEEEFKLKPYPQMWKSNLKARLLPQFPRFYMGIYQK